MAFVIDESLQHEILIITLVVNEDGVFVDFGDDTISAELYSQICNSYPDKHFLTNFILDLGKRINDNRDVHASSTGDYNIEMTAGMLVDHMNFIDNEIQAEINSAGEDACPTPSLFRK